MKPNAVLVTLIAAGMGLAGAGTAHAGDPRLLPPRVYDAEALLAAAAPVAPAAAMQVSEDHKDPRKAMLLSLLLPGLGELWLGHKTRASLFFAAEAGIWTTYGVFQVQGAHRRELYKEYAEVFADVPQREDDDFYRTIGNFIAADGPFSANEQIRRQARAIYPNDRAAQERYLQENGYFGDDAWEWDSEESFDRFKDMRSRSLASYNNADLTLGLLVANRLFSVVDAGILAAKRNRDLAERGSTFSWSLEAGPEGPGARLVLARTF
jgi:hypothetical protein